MELSKAFDTINHLLIAQLHVYGFSNNALKLIFSCMSDRWLRSKINKLFSSLFVLLQGVPQESVLGPILFNIYPKDLFIFLRCDACNFASDTIRYVCGKNFDFLLTKLEEHSAIAIEWSENNYMKMNSVECHLFILGNKFEHLWAKIGNNRIWENRTVKLLGITVDNELKFDEHLSNACMNSNRKFNALT